METATTTLYPLLFRPVYKDYIWGGDRIPRRYGRSMPPGVYAESWELSDRPEGMSLVVNGSLAGRDLRDLVRTHGADLLGRAANSFPLLLKLIDARESLSVQVHPSEATAAATGGEPKTEMWYVLDAAPGAGVYAGLQPGTTRAAFQAAVAASRVEDVLRFMAVRPGDVVYIPGGRVHAIGAGCLLLEAQQNSNTTYRVYDWCRMGADGRPRELHLAQALAAIDWSDQADPTPLATSTDRQPDGRGGEVLHRLSTPFFLVEQVLFGKTTAGVTNGKTFHALFVEAGSLRVRAKGVQVEAGPGTTVLVPAAVGGYELLGLGGEHRVVRISLP